MATFTERQEINGIINHYEDRLKRILVYGNTCNNFDEYRDAVNEYLGGAYEDYLNLIAEQRELLKNLPEDPESKISF